MQESAKALQPMRILHFIFTFIPHLPPADYPPYPQPMCILIFYLENIIFSLLNILVSTHTKIPA